jgi:hypothetical protein
LHGGRLRGLRPPDRFSSRIEEMQVLRLDRETDFRVAY